MNTPTLDALFDAVWEGLDEGASRAAHGFHLPVVSTVRDGRPAGRVVVLRVSDRDERRLAFHTDARSHKTDELAAGVSWTAYDADSRLQVRAWGPSAVADEPTTDARWAASRLSSRKCYLIQPGPGTVVDAWTSGHEGKLDGAVVPALPETLPGRANFAVVETEVRSLEVLSRRRTGHQRARFIWDAGWTGTWLVP